MAGYAAWLAVAALVLSGDPPTRWDHLEPSGGVFGEPARDYFVAVADLLVPGADCSVAMIAFPSFDPQYAVYVRRDRFQYVRGPDGGIQSVRPPFIVSVRLDRNVSRYEEVPDGGARFSANAAVTEVAISEATARAIEGAWKAALDDAHPSDTALVVADGSHHFFVDNAWAGPREARTGTATDGPRVQSLIALGDKMVAFSRVEASKRDQLEKELIADADALAKRFRATAPRPR